MNTQEEQKAVGFSDRFSIGIHTTAKLNGKEPDHKNTFNRKTKLCAIFLQLNHKGTSFSHLYRGEEVCPHHRLTVDISSDVLPT